jgi:hypothetical protein
MRHGCTGAWAGSVSFICHTVFGLVAADMYLRLERKEAEAGGTGSATDLCLPAVSRLVKTAADRLRQSRGGGRFLVTERLGLIA